MSDLMSALGGLNTYNKSNNLFAENIVIQVTGFDPANEHVLGKRVDGNGVKGDDLRFHLDPYFNNIPSRPTWVSLNAAGEKSCLSIGDIFLIQNATLRKGVYEYKWGNIVSRDIKTCIVRTAPAILFPSKQNGAQEYQVALLLKEDSAFVCNSLKDMESAINAISKNSQKTNELDDTSIMFQVVCQGICFSQTLKLSTKDVKAHNADTAVDNIENNEKYVKFLSVLSEYNGFGEPNAVIKVIPVKSAFVARPRLRKYARNSMFYKLEKEGRSYWRDSIFMFEKVFSKNQNKYFWSLQFCLPSHYKTPFMPNAFAGDVGNLLREDVNNSQQTSPQGNNQSSTPQNINQRGAQAHHGNNYTAPQSNNKFSNQGYSQSQNNNI